MLRVPQKCIPDPLSLVWTLGGTSRKEMYKVPLNIHTRTLIQAYILACQEKRGGQECGPSLQNHSGPHSFNMGECLATLDH